MDFLLPVCNDKENEKSPSECIVYGFFCQEKRQFFKNAI